MKQYTLTTLAAEQKWDICKRQITYLCVQGKIDAIKLSGVWLINTEAPNPRTKTTRRPKEAIQCE